MSLFKTISRPFSYITTENVREFLKMSESGFDGVLKKVTIVNCEKGSCLAEMTVDEEHTNSMKGLHGGLSATLVDTITSFALLTYENKLMIPSVSVDLHMSYLKGAVVGDKIVIDARTQRAGKTLAFLKCEIRNKATGDILVKGSHTKYFIYPKK